MTKNQNKLLSNPVNIANFLTLARLLTVPFIVWLLINNHFYLLFYVIIGVGLTDALDGFIARHFNCESELGRALDPIADKALLVCLYVTLSFKKIFPTWLTVSVVSRDVIIVSGIILAHMLGKKLIMKPIFISKINTVLQLLTVLYVITVAAFNFENTWHYPIITPILFWGTLFTTLISMACYIIIGLRCLEEEP